MAVCVVGSFRWHCVFLGILGGNVHCGVFYVAMCVVGFLDGKVVCIL